MNERELATLAVWAFGFGLVIVAMCALAYALEHFTGEDDGGDW